MQSFGGHVSMRSNTDGSDSPYEINISYFDALKGTNHGIDQWQVPRFITSQAIMLAIKGIPAIYIQSLLATPNDHAGVQKTGRTRSINRRKWDHGELQGLLDNPFTPNRLVLHEIQRLLKVRKEQPSFHPDAAQRILSLGDEFFGAHRLAIDGRQEVLAISNLTELPQHLCLKTLTGLSLGTYRFDLFSGENVVVENETTILQPYQTVWLNKATLT